MDFCAFGAVQMIAACTALAPDQVTCTQWLDLSTFSVALPDLAALLVSIALVFAVAWGFRLVVSFLLNR